VNEKNDFQNILNKIKKEKFPENIQITVYSKNKTVIRENLGKPYKYFDVSSLTKIMVTTPLIMKLVNDKKLNLNDRLEKYLGFLQGRAPGQIKIIDLLRHKSGLEWWRPYFKELMKCPVTSRVAVLKKIFAAEKVGRSEKCVYSDLDFILLGWVIEEILSLSLDEAAHEYIFKPLKMGNTRFLRCEFGKKSQFAPTGNDKRRGYICGEVDDDNCWAMGGVSGHAGLFSTMDDTLKFAVSIWNAYNGKSNKIFNAKLVKKFAQRSVSQSIGDWALGFMVPSRPVSTAGTKVSSNAFGHVGYTGTSIWIDVKRKAIVTVLANGSYPNRDNTRFGKLRKQLHDAIWELLDEQK